jgi:hypothetical protein
MSTTTSATQTIGTLANHYLGSMYPTCSNSCRVTTSTQRLYDQLVSQGPNRAGVV